MQNLSVTGWSKETVYCNIFQTDINISKIVITQWFLETLYHLVLVFWYLKSIKWKKSCIWEQFQHKAISLITRAEHSDSPSDASKLQKHPKKSLRYPLITSPGTFKTYLDITKHQQTPTDTHRHHETPTGVKRHCHPSSNGTFGHVGMSFCICCFLVFLLGSCDMQRCLEWVFESIQVMTLDVFGVWMRMRVFLSVKPL